MAAVDWLLAPVPRRLLVPVGGAGAADVVVVLAQRRAAEADAVHVEPLVAAAVALHPVHFFACGESLCLVF